MNNIRKPGTQEISGVATKGLMPFGVLHFSVAKLAGSRRAGHER
jgi:hypothetical protein